MALPKKMYENFYGGILTPICLSCIYTQRHKYAVMTCEKYGETPSKYLGADTDDCPFYTPDEKLLKDFYPVVDFPTRSKYI